LATVIIRGGAALFFVTKGKWPEIFY